ncbi:MAG: hypothetical protein IR164_05725 [Devosia sp.]|uniref:hypothetical protein n=1 Tax=Devosia sp. TaxID=1871048 RepID=UPI0019E19F0A|nr:hypothetical protein [Devosia sp.]MBF0678425.1 hypothetical protein [Devosia sp.]
MYAVPPSTLTLPHRQLLKSWRCSDTISCSHSKQRALLRMMMSLLNMSASPHDCFATVEDGLDDTRQLPNAAAWPRRADEIEFVFCERHGGSYGFSICFDTRETEKIALSCAQGEGQKWQIQRASWDVENDTSKMRERMEERGLSVEPLGKRYIDGPTIYRISQRGAQNAE